MGKTVKKLVNATLTVVAVALFGLIAAVVLVPLVMGWVPLTVLSGSMEPTIPTGSQVVLQRAETPQAVAQLKNGDVITFMPLPNNPTLVTHRIVAMSANSDGTMTFITRGDNNNANDPSPVESKMVRGVVKYHVPYVGYVATALNQEQKSIGIMIVASLLFGYAAIHVIVAMVRGVRERRTAHARGKREVASTGSRSPEELPT